MFFFFKIQETLYIGFNLSFLYRKYGSDLVQLFTACSQRVEAQCFSPHGDCSALNSVWLQQPKGPLTQHQRTVKVTQDTSPCKKRLCFHPQHATGATSQNGNLCQESRCVRVFDTLIVSRTV